MVHGELIQDSDIDCWSGGCAQSDGPCDWRSRKAYKALHGMVIPKDILVMTRAEVERKASAQSSLVSQALWQGKVIYG